MKKRIDTMAQVDDTHYVPINRGYYPEGSSSHYMGTEILGGEYNTCTLFYSDVIFHRPYYPGASEGDLNRGRLTQNFWFHDQTDFPNTKNDIPIYAAKRKPKIRRNNL